MHACIHTYIHTYIFVVVNFDALAQASDIQIEMRQVVFLCWMQDLNPGPQTPNRQQTECSLTNRLSYRGSSKNLNSTYIHIYMFVVVNFDALAQASDIRIERIVFLCWRQDSNPSGSQTPNRQQTECPLTNRLSYRGSSLKLELDSPSLWSASIQPTRPHSRLAFAPGSGDIHVCC